MAICPTQLLSDAASAIADRKPEPAAEILTHVNQVSNALGTPEQRLSFYMAAAEVKARSLTAVEFLHGERRWQAEVAIGGGDRRLRERER